MDCGFEHFRSAIGIEMGFRCLRAEVAVMAGRGCDCTRENVRTFVSTGIGFRGIERKERGHNCSMLLVAAMLVPA